MLVHERVVRASRRAACASKAGPLRQSHRALIVIVASVLGPILTLAAPAPLGGQSADRTPTQEVVGTLERQGVYDSLMEAVERARHGLSYREHTDLPGQPDGHAAPSSARAMRAYFTRKDLPILSPANAVAAWQWGLRLVGYGSRDDLWRENKPLAREESTDDAFAVSLGVSEDTVVVGALFDDHTGSSSDSASVFVRSGTTWKEQARLVGSDVAADDFFGYSVAISLNTVVIGAFGSDDRGIDCGSVYVFVRDGTTWSEGVKLVASDGHAGDNFGLSVAVSLDTVVAGAVGAKDRGEGSGSVYVFVRRGTTWTEEAKLLARDGKAGDNFGSSVAISADTVVVEASGNDDGGSCSGSAYVFERRGTTWSEQAKLCANDGYASHLFGPVTVDADTLVGTHRSPSPEHERCPEGGMGPASQ